MTGHVCEWRLHDWTCVSGGYMMDMCEWRLHDGHV